MHSSGWVGDVLWQKGSKAKNIKIKKFAYFDTPSLC